MKVKVKIKVGDKFGRLIVLRCFSIKKSNRTRRMCECECDCGNKIISHEYSISHGLTMSCGCYNRERIIDTNSKHGLGHHHLYCTWKRIKTRCYNSNNPDYRLYGAIGVKMFEGWKDNPADFIYYCMKIKGWDDMSLSIDRINPYGGYEPNNIRFATPHIQSANKRTRHRIGNNKYTGITKSWNKYQVTIGVDYKTIYLGSFDTEIDAVASRNNYIKNNNLIGYPIQVIKT